MSDSTHHDETQMRAALRNQPISPFLRNRLGDILLAQGQASAALSEFKHSAQQYLHQGMFKRAIAVLRKAVRQAPMDTALAERLVAACRLGNRPALAANTYFDLSTRFTEVGDEEAAYQFFARGVDENPVNIEKTKRLIRWALSRGDRDRAADLWLRIARQMVQHADFRQATAFLDRARALRNGPKAAMVGMELLVAQGAHEDARMLLLGSLRRFPNHAGLLDALSRFKGNQGAASPHQGWIASRRKPDDSAKLVQAKAWLDQGYAARALSLVQRILLSDPGQMAALALAEAIHRQSGYLSRIQRLYVACAERLVRENRMQEAWQCLDRSEALIPGSTRAIRRVLMQPGETDQCHSQQQ